MRALAWDQVVLDRLVSSNAELRAKIESNEKEIKRIRRHQREREAYKYYEVVLEVPWFETYGLWAPSLEEARKIAEEVGLPEHEDADLLSEVGGGSKVLEVREAEIPKAMPGL